MNSRRNSAPPITIAGVFLPADTFYGGCTWETFGSAGFLDSRFTNLRTAATPSLGNERGSASNQGTPPRPKSAPWHTAVWPSLPCTLTLHSLFASTATTITWLRSAPWKRKGARNEKAIRAVGGTVSYPGKSAGFHSVGIDSVWGSTATEHVHASNDGVAPGPRAAPPAPASRTSINRSPCPATALYC